MQTFLKSVGHRLELHLPHRSQQHLAAGYLLEDLDGPFLAQFLEALPDCMDFSGARGRTMRNSSGAK